MGNLYSKNHSSALTSIIFFTLIDLALSAFFSSISIFIVGAIGTVIVFLLRPEVDRRSEKLFILIKIFTVLAVLLSYYNCEALFSKPYYIGGSDDLHSETDAFDFIKSHYNWPWDWPLFVKDKGFIWMLAKLISFAGVEHYHTIAFRVLNEDILIATSVLCYRISKYRLSLNKKQAVNVLAVAALFPNSLYLSSFVFRDTICAFFMLLVFALSDDLFKKNGQIKLVFDTKIPILVLLGVLFFLSFWIRPEALFFEIAIVGLSVLKDNTIKGKNVLYLLVAFVGVYYVLTSIGAFETVNHTIDAYSEYRLDETVNSSNAIFKLIFTLPLLPFGIILRAVWGFLSPFPVQLINLFSIFSKPTDIFGIIVAIGMIPYYLYIAFFFKGIVRLDKYMLAFSMIFLGYIISTFTFRHVLLFYPYFWMILLKNYYQSSSKYKNQIKKVSFAVLFMLPVLYMITKLL